jgi:ribosomal protein S7
VRRDVNLEGAVRQVLVAGVGVMAAFGIAPTRAQAMALAALYTAAQALGTAWVKRRLAASAAASS